MFANPEALLQDCYLRKPHAYREFVQAHKPLSELQLRLLQEVGVRASIGSRLLADVLGLDEKQVAKNLLVLWRSGHITRKVDPNVPNGYQYKARSHVLINPAERV